MRRLDVRWVLVGEDFRFGKGSAGDISTLRAAAKTFSVEAMRTVSVDHERASSTAVRHALASGNLGTRPRCSAAHSQSPDVSRMARSSGRTLGFPTANVRLKRLPPVSGIFAVRVHGSANCPLRGVASVGVRPTIDDSGDPLLEVFIFDFDRDIYGRRVIVEFLHKLRDEERLPDLDALEAPNSRRRCRREGVFASRRLMAELAAR